jgi:hypothetical protein
MSEWPWAQLGAGKKPDLNHALPHPGPLLRGEGESFAVPLKIRGTGFAGGSAGETENVRWLFPLLGGEGQGEGGLKN